MAGLVCSIRAVRPDMELKTSALHWLVAGVQSKSGFHNTWLTPKSWHRNRVVRRHPRWRAAYRVRFT